MSIPAVSIWRANQVRPPSGMKSAEPKRILIAWNQSREALVEALTAYSGAVILVSHDMHLLGLVADRLWLVKGGAVTRVTPDGTVTRLGPLIVDVLRARAGEGG